MKLEIFLQIYDELDELNVLLRESLSVQGLLVLLFVLVAVAVGVVTSSLRLAAVTVVAGLSLTTLAAALGDALKSRVAAHRK